LLSWKDYRDYDHQWIYTEPNNGRTMLFLNNFFILCNFLPQFKLQLCGISVKVPNRFLSRNDFISSHAHPNGIFASALESRVVWQSPHSDYVTRCYFNLCPQQGSRGDRVSRDVFSFLHV